jgi:hypothetical protein
LGEEDPPPPQAARKSRERRRAVVRNGACLMDFLRGRMWSGGDGLRKGYRPGTGKVTERCGAEGRPYPV